ncbi:MAG: HlyC/CorC family transporter [Deltaproteobacteria bacterium]|nr:MAG: HlyC/CorC family transporter [Deltaproteobacteria bacterium]
MDPSPLFKILLIGILLILSALFSGSETALFSLGRFKLHLLKEQGRAGKIPELLAHPRRLLITILLGNDLINICASAVAASLVISLWGDPYKWLSILIMVPLLLIFGEITPKTIAVNYSREFSLLVARPLSFFTRFVLPLRWLVEKIAGLFLNLFRRKEHPRDYMITEDEFRTLIDVGKEEGVLEETETELIHKVFGFGDTLVSEVTIPASRIFCLPYNLSRDKVLEEISKNRYSRVPVYKKSKDNIVGILYAKDLLTLGDGWDLKERENWQKLLRPPYFIPLGKTADRLFREFQEKRIHLAIVVNQSGKVAGLVTMEDLLEELFGEIAS